MLLKRKYLVLVIKKKTDYNTKIHEIKKKIADHSHDKYITTLAFNKLTLENIAPRSKQANLASKSDVANFVNKTYFNNKLKYVPSNKNELNKLSKKAKAISTNGGIYFSLGIIQNCLVFIVTKKYIKCFHGTTQTYSWKSNGTSEESIENITKSDSNFAPAFVDHHSLPEINLNGHCLINTNISIPKEVINLYISYTFVHN